MTEVFYLYAYLRSKDSNLAKKGTPYYIGKGKGRRYKSKKHNVSVPKDKNQIVFLSHNLNEYDAYDLEIRLIRWYGRIDLDTGILYNRTNGGNGPIGRSIESITKQKESLKNTISSDPDYSIKQSKIQKIAQNKPDVQEDRRLRNSDKKFKEFHRQCVIDGISNSTYKGEIRRQLSISVFNKPEIREKHKEILNSDKVKEKRLIGLEKYWANEENKQIRSKIQMETRKIKIHCNYCDIDIDRQNYAKWHGDKCKMRINSND